MSKKSEWKMPEWMEPYRELINNTGGNSIEELMDVYNTPEKRWMETNMPLAVLALMCAGQVKLLDTLHEEGKLNESTDWVQFAKDQLKGQPPPDLEKLRETNKPYKDSIIKNLDETRK